MPPQEPCLSTRQRYQPLALPPHLSDEELVRNWTLSAGDHQASARDRKGCRFSMALQICAVRVYGRFRTHVHEVSPPMLNDLGQQLALPPSLTVEVPERDATVLEHRQNVLKHLGLQRFDPMAQAQLDTWDCATGTAGYAARGPLSAGGTALVRPARPAPGAIRARAAPHACLVAGA